MFFTIASATLGGVMDTPPTFTFRTTFKDWIDITQSIVTISAVFVGGFWTYDVFIKERHDYPHANVEQKINHLSLADKELLLRVGLDLTNTGSSLLEIDRSTIRIQQILPLASCSNDPCAMSQLKDAAAAVERKDDRFNWPLIADRDDKRSKQDKEIGWYASMPTIQSSGAASGTTAGVSSSLGGPIVNINLHIHLPENKSRRDYEDIIEDTGCRRARTPCPDEQVI
jgi:hypothetical protein